MSSHHEIRIFPVCADSMNDRSADVEAIVCAHQGARGRQTDSFCLFRTVVGVIEPNTDIDFPNDTGFLLT